MKFALQKLTKDALVMLKPVSLSLLKPFQVLASPVYIFFERNEKFVPLKAPLSHFLPEELEKFQTQKRIYISKFAEKIKPFQEAGESIHKLFNCFEKRVIKSNKGEKTVLIPLSVFELNKAALTLASPLWGKNKKVEPFFISFFADEVCGPFTNEFIQINSEKNQELYELAMIRSGFTVFWALHLGFVDQKFLIELRRKTFELTMIESAYENYVSEVDEVIGGVFSIIRKDNVSQPVLFDDLLKWGKAGKKLSFKINKISSYILNLNTEESSVYGEGGVCVEQ